MDSLGVASIETNCFFHLVITKLNYELSLIVYIYINNCFFPVGHVRNHADTPSITSISIKFLRYRKRIKKKCLFDLTFSCVFDVLSRFTH